MANHTLGSAAFYDWEGLPWQKAKSGFGKIGLIGYPSNGNTKNVVYCRAHRHFVSVAPTRSGKGVSLIIPNLLTYRGSVIVIDPKGENAWITAEQRRNMGQKVVILDPWGEVNRRYGDKVGEKEETARYNPLSILDPKGPDYTDDLAYIADALIISQGKDPHWDASARELVAGLIAYLIETFGAGVPTLSMLRILLSMSSEDLAGIARSAQKLGPNSVAARKLGRFKEDRTEISSIISTALTQTAFLDSKTLEEHLSLSDFSFDDLVNEPTTVYLVLPVDKLQTYGRWLRLLVSIGIRTLARNEKQLNSPVLFLLDEFGTIGRLSAISQAFGLMAGLQMCVWVFIQDFIQLKRDYPDEWETFVANAAAVTFFNVMDQFTTEYLSNMLGYKTVERISVATAEEREKKPEYSSMSDQLFARKLLYPDEIRTFPQDKGIMVWRDDPVVFKKIEYHKLPFFIKRARWNPLTPKLPNLEESPLDIAIENLKEGYVEDAIWILKYIFDCKVFKKKASFTLKNNYIILFEGKKHYTRKGGVIDFAKALLLQKKGIQV